MEHVPNLVYPWMRGLEVGADVKPSCTHNHHGGIVSDGSCPGCLEYAEILAEDIGELSLDEVLGMDLIVNTEENYQIMNEGEIEP